MRLSHALLSLGLLSLSVIARADTIGIYQFSGAQLEQKSSQVVTGTISGYISIDLTNPLTAVATANAYNFTVNVTNATTASNDGTYTYTTAPIITQTTNTTDHTTVYYKAVFSSPSGSGVSGTAFDLLFTDVNNVITLCDRSTNGSPQACGPSANTFLNTQPGNQDDVTGTLVAISPEPSSLLLLGSGLVSLVGIGRKRFAR